MRSILWWILSRGFRKFLRNPNFHIQIIQFSWQNKIIKIVKETIHDKLVTQCFEKDEYNSKNELMNGRNYDDGFKIYQLARPACADLCKKIPTCKGFHYDNFRTQRLCVISLLTKELDSYLIWLRCCKIESQWDCLITRLWRMNQAAWLI